MEVYHESRLPVTSRARYSSFTKTLNHCTDQVIFRDQLPPAAACTRARSGSGARTPRYPIHTHGRSSPPASVRGSSPTAAEVPTDGDDPALAGAARGRKARDPTGDESDAAPSSIHPIPPARTQQQALRIAHRLSGRVGPSPSGRLRRAPHRTAPHGRQARRAQARAAHVNRRAPGGNGRAEAIKKSRWGCWSSVPCRRRRSAWNSVRLSIRSGSSSDGPSHKPVGLVRSFSSPSRLPAVVVPPSQVPS